MNILAGSTWRNNKTGRYYEVLGTATDCTNERNGTRTVIYYDRELRKELFVREQDEFERKFTPQPTLPGPIL